MIIRLIIIIIIIIRIKKKKKMKKDNKKNIIALFPSCQFPPRPSPPLPTTCTLFINS